MNFDIDYYLSPIGLLLITATKESITAVLFIDNPDTFVITENKNQSDNPVIQQCITQLSEYFTGKRKKFDLPIQQQGTPFQQMVWASLLRIDYGKTVSYLEISKTIGDAKAVRAVGTSNGKNKISIIVPCHRVIGSKGNLTGYAGGLWRKHWLLQHEAKNENGLLLLL